MENQNRWKLRISRLLRSSCGSCKSRNTSDVIDRSEIVSHTHQRYQLIELFSPISHPFPSIFRPKSPQPPRTELIPIPRIPDPNPILTPQNTEGRKCPPSSPISPLIAFREFEQSESKPNRKKSKRKKKKKATQLLKRGNSENYYDDNEAEEEDDDDEKTTFFSSVSLSSDSSDSLRRNRANHNVNRPTEEESGMCVIPLQGKVKDSFVVKKRSSDPQDDFRNSMVEMIVEMQIFGARDLEDLLQTFLSLNSSHHHRVIVEVFTEIWDALFSKSS